MSSLIQLKNIVKIYKTGDSELVALKGISLDVPHGECLSIMGSSGSGKSTLLNTIGMLDRPNSGSYIFDGKKVEDLNDDQRSSIRNSDIGFVFQSFFLLPRLNSIQNVLLPTLYSDTILEDPYDKAMHLLDLVGIKHLAKHKPTEMSGGQQQRVAIARSLICDPKFLIGDEPTGALDSKTSEEVLQLFFDINKKENKTVILVTHDPKVGERCPRVIQFDDGKILADRAGELS